ncbi:hypothetical protein MC378_14745 [Polaribacter sp. MSW13]|uniref:Uncharacterized protein n=1 Tax=Polaribacter marinus TaxID=2916838 RepID=A0A9X1VQJ7_9FLAO|nr:hypothetical protein [Polaribacter marinus]MCI2230435.1 hypothetical protein [Polaribacter marinus]
MKKKIIITFFFILIIPIGIIFWKFNEFKNEPYQKTPFFDLFIAKSMYKTNEETPWRDFWDNSWQNVSKENKRPIEWISNPKDFEKLDSVYLGFRNNTNEKFYYVTWGEPNSRIRENFLVYRNGKIDSIPFGGFGCGTGIYITPLKNGEIAGSKFLNPLLFNPFTNYFLPLKNKKFPQLFKEIYGDSVAIKYEQATYSLPWNKFPSQMIESKKIVISTERIIENWKKGQFKLSPEFEKENEQSFYIKENGEYILSSTYEKKEKIE